MGTDGELDHEADDEERPERGSHRGQGSFEDCAEQCAERDGEQRVADRHDAALPEVRGADAVANAVERTGPPRENRAEHCGRRDCNDAGQHQLGREPAGSGDALGPRQQMGAGFELSSDERCAPERSEQCGNADEGGAKKAHRLLERRQVGRVARDRLVGGDEQNHYGDCCKRGQRGLGSELPVREPGHDRTASSDAGPGSLAASVVM